MQHHPRRFAWTAALGFLLGLSAATAVHAQVPSYPQTIADKSVIGRLGSGSGSGPTQAIPFATLMAQLNGLNTIVGGPATTTVGNMVLWNNITGTSVKDSGIAITGTGTIALGTAGGVSIASGKTATDTSVVGANLLLGATGGGFAAYAGASCTNGSFPNAISAAGVFTCQTPMTGGANVLRNSSLAAWFHGSGSLSITTAGGWCAEGVYLIPTGATVTCAQTTTAPTTGYYGDKITSAASVTDIKVRFVVESFDAAKIAGQAVTFEMVWINNSGASLTPTIATKYPTAQDNWASSTADLAASNMSACSNGSTCTSAYTFTMSASATTGYEVIIDFGALGASGSNSVTLGSGFALQATPGLTTGINATPPYIVTPDQAKDIAWCERFYQTSYDNGTAPGAATHLGMVGAAVTAVGASARLAGQVVFRVPMRAVPSVSYWDGAGNASKISTTSDNSVTFTDNEAAQFAPSNISTKSFIFVGLTATVTVAFIQYAADATISGG